MLKSAVVIMPVAVMLTGLCLGCASWGIASWGIDYNLVLVNLSSKMIYDAEVYYRGFRVGGGVFPPGWQSREDGLDIPMPDRATVQWRESMHGPLDQQQVDMRGLVPRSFHGDVVFKFHDQGKVTVETMARYRSGT
jgi:hypothetical protein